jgi:hypothetical protein
MKGPAGPFRSGRTILNQSLGSRGTGHLPAANVLAVVPENVDETGAWGRQKSPKPRCGSRSLVGAGYSGVSMSRWPRSGQGCSKASVNARPGDGRTWTNAYRSHPRHPSWDAWPRSSQVPSVWPLFARSARPPPSDPPWCPPNQHTDGLGGSFEWASTRSAPGMSRMSSGRAASPRSPSPSGGPSGRRSLQGRFDVLFGALHPRHA